MRILSFILAIALSIVVTIFALSNDEYVQINYLFGEMEVVLPVLIFFLLLVGLVIGGLFFSQFWWKNYRKTMKLKKENNQLLQEISTLKEQVIQSKQQASASQDEFTKDVDLE